MENSKTNLNVVQRFYDAYNKKQEAILNEVIANDDVDYGHRLPAEAFRVPRATIRILPAHLRMPASTSMKCSGACDSYRAVCGAFTDTKEGSGSRNQPLSAP